MRYLLFSVVFLTACSQSEHPCRDYWTLAVRSCAFAHGWVDYNYREQIQPAGNVTLRPGKRTYAVSLSPDHIKTCVVDKETYVVLEKR